MTDAKEEDITITHENLGARKGVLVVILRTGGGKRGYRVERQWNRGKSKEIMTLCGTEECARGYVRGVRDGIKLSSD